MYHNSQAERGSVAFGPLRGRIQRTQKYKSADHFESLPMSPVVMQILSIMERLNQ